LNPSENYGVWQRLEQNPRAGIFSMKPGGTVREIHCSKKRKARIKHLKKK